MSTQVCKPYPSDAASFIAIFPDVYDPDDPPVASKIDAGKLLDCARKDKMPTRNTNKALHTTTKPTTQFAGATASYGKSQMDMLKMCMGFMIGNHNMKPDAPMLKGQSATSVAHERERCDVGDHRWATR